MIVLDTVATLVDEYGEADKAEKTAKKKKERLRGELLDHFGDTPDLLAQGEKFVIRAATRTSVVLNQERAETLLREKDLYDDVATPKVSVPDPAAALQLMEDLLRTMESEGMDTSGWRKQAGQVLPIEGLEVTEATLERLHRTGMLGVDDVTSLHDVKTSVVLTPKPRAE